jgi:diphosphoinositol-polyphosphate diphosphatase
MLQVPLTLYFFCCVYRGHQIKHFVGTMHRIFLLNTTKLYVVAMNGINHSPLHNLSSSLPAGEEEKRDASTGTKISPVCSDEDMKLQATSTEELRRQCFPASFSLTQVDVIPRSVAAEEEPPLPLGTLQPFGDDDKNDLLKSLMEKCAAINSMVVDRTTSRHGRSSQRFVVDDNSTESIRLVTGCVPILTGGMIMVVSASKKKEWILPKGGWEMDEELEESAIRETFEEAGVMGVLGPKLSEIQYETRKARKRRLEKEGSREHDGDQHVISSSYDNPRTTSEPSHPVTPQPEVSMSKEEDPNGGKKEAPLVYTQVCAKLFPLYIKEVLSTWPENGRLRKAVDIDEAIELMAERPEMQSVLLEVKARGLHLVT